MSEDKTSKNQPSKPKGQPYNPRKSPFEKREIDSTVPQYEKPPIVPKKK